MLNKRNWLTPGNSLAKHVFCLDNGVHFKELQNSLAKMRFLSIEPLLEDLGTVDLQGIQRPAFYYKRLVHRANPFCVGFSLG